MFIMELFNFKNRINIIYQFIFQAIYFGVLRLYGNRNE